MVDPTWNKEKISAFRGVQSFLDNTEGSPENALDAVNVEYRADGDTIRTRLGFGIATNVTAEQASAAYNWVSEIGNYLVWYRPGVGVKIGNIAAADFAASIVTVIAETTPASAQFLPNGNRLYVCFLDANQRSTFHGYVITRIGGVFFADKLFAPPVTNLTFTITEPLSGRVTAGRHYIGIVLEHRGGFIGRPSPDSGTGTPDTTTFQRYAFIAAGNKNLQIQITPGANWPASVVRAHLVFTTVANPSLLFFVPDKVVSVNAGTTNAITFTIDAEDSELRQAIKDDEYIAASKLLLLDTQTVGGAAPYNPYCLFSYGDRLGMVAQITEPDGNKVCSLLLSERNNYERFSITRSLIRLPSQLPITLAFALGQQICILGPNNTHTTADTGGDPIGWAIPERVGDIGTPAAKGVDVDTVNTYALVADKSGLYAFNGFRYSLLPISYAQTDKWRTINWAFAHLLEVRNDTQHKTVYVLAPTGDGPTPTMKLWAWSYKNFDPRYMDAWWKRVDYSELTMPAYAFGGLCLVQNDTPTAHAAAKSRRELWLYSRSTATHFRRQKVAEETYPYRDGDNASPETIFCAYAPGHIPGKIEAAVNRHHGLHAQLSGAGYVTVNAKEKNNSGNAMALTPPIALSAAPQELHLFGCDLLAGQVEYRFTNSGPDSYFVVHNITAYYSPEALFI